jgi:hypothetical protein
MTITTTTAPGRPLRPTLEDRWADADWYATRLPTLRGRLVARARFVALTGPVLAVVAMPWLARRLLTSRRLVLLLVGAGVAAVLLGSWLR